MGATDDELEMLSACQAEVGMSVQDHMGLVVVLVVRAMGLTVMRCDCEDPTTCGVCLGSKVKLVRPWWRRR